MVIGSKGHRIIELFSSEHFCSHYEEGAEFAAQRLTATGTRIIGTVHDEIILEVPEKIADDSAVILRLTMIEAAKALLSRVPVEVEVTIGNIWAEKQKSDSG